MTKVTSLHAFFHYEISRPYDWDDEDEEDFWEDSEDDDWDDESDDY